jgi:hypothetical protein
MPRELKQDRRALSEGSSPRIARRTLPEIAAEAARPVVEPRTFAALDPNAEPAPPPSRTPLYWAVALLGAAVVVAALPMPLAIRIGLPLVMAVASAHIARRSPVASPVRGPAARAIRIDGQRVTFNITRARPEGRDAAVEAAPEPLVLLDLASPFGVTLLASPRRDRAVALLSSRAGTYYLGAACDPGARRALAPLLDRALTVAHDDVGLEAIGPDGLPLFFAPEALASLIDALLELSPACLDRFVLTDAHGTPLTLDGRLLCVADHALDLDAPLEWKPILFQEAFGSAVAVYQGTWVRQGNAEVVLVSLLPALGPPPGADLDLGTVDRAVLRDLRLMQASPAEPPPAEQRVAIERLFMLPLRSALDRAPRASHQPNRAQA